MRTRKQLLAAGSAAAMVAGGLFLSAAPASADHTSTECLSAQSAFTAALHNVELNAELKVELATALQNLVNAQETLDLLRVDGTLTRAEVEAQIDVLVGETRTKVPNLPAIQALINANAGGNSAVGQARALIDVAVNGPLNAATLEALAAAGVEPELFLLAPLLDAAALTAAVNATVLPTGLDQALVAALLLDISNGDDVLTASNVTTLATLGLDVAEFETQQFDVVAIKAALDGVVTVGEQEAALALVAALDGGDITAVLEAEAALEALVGDKVDLTALVNLQTQLLKAEAILDAQADLNAAVAVVNGLRVQLSALDIDLIELETLFDTAIEACDSTSAVGGVDNNNSDTGAGAGGGAVTAGTSTGGAVASNAGTTAGAVTTVSGTNRGMNVQTAAVTADADPAGLGALVAGLGLVAAGTLAARRIRTS